MKYMLDTDICIYLINSKSPSLLNNFKLNFDKGICISAITLSELKFGVVLSQQQIKNANSLNQFTSAITVLSYNEKAAEHYGIIRAELQRQGNLIGPLDMLIASHATSMGLILVTNNVREYKRVPNLQFETWV